MDDMHPQIYAQQAQQAISQRDPPPEAQLGHGRCLGKNFLVAEDGELDGVFKETFDYHP